MQCEGLAEQLIFNSLTNCLGPRKLLHSGKLYKTKSNKELHGFLFNDFLLLTYMVKQFAVSSGSEKLFSSKSNAQFRMYKTPIFLNEVLVKLPTDPSSDEPVFHISHIDRVYTLRTDNINERTAWVQKIKAASEQYIDTEKKKREKAYQARSQKTSGIGRLMVHVIEATELKACKPNGKSNPYCEVSMGSQSYTTRTLQDTLNPKWNFNCQFFIKDLYQDVLCLTMFDRDQFLRMISWVVLKFHWQKSEQNRKAKARPPADSCCMRSPLGRSGSDLTCSFLNKNLSRSGLRTA